MAIHRVEASRKSTGGKCPRSSLEGHVKEITASTSDRGHEYKLVEFLKKNGASGGIEVVPVHWIVVKGREIFCKWPKKLKGGEVEELVLSKTIPSETWIECRVKILYSAHSYEKVKSKMDAAAYTSSLSTSQEEEREPLQVEDSAEEDNPVEASEESSEEEPPPKRKLLIKKKSVYHQKKSANLKQEMGKASKRVPSGSAPALRATVEGPRCASLSIRNASPMPSTSLLTPRRSPRFVPLSLGSLSPQLQTIRSNNTVEPLNNLTTVRQLFSTSENKIATPSCNHSNCVSQGYFDAFSLKLFMKLNGLQEEIRELKETRSSPLVRCPDMGLVIPVKSIEDLKKLELELQDNDKRLQMARYLTQCGGKQVPDFLGRCLPRLIADELCESTNWSGLNKEHSFRLCKNVLQTLLEAALFNSKTSHATKENIEAYVKSWLLKYKDRMNPAARTHAKKDTVVVV